MPPGKARAYIVAMISAGAVVIGWGLWNWRTEDWPRFLFLLAMSALASRMKVTLSAGAGTMSMNFLFILVAIQWLSLGETLTMGAVGILVQRLVKAKNKPTLVQALFNVASIACSIGAAYTAYHAAVFAGGWVERPLLLLLAAGVFFLTNTFSVALVIAFTEGKTTWAVWGGTYFWSFPNYLVGAAVAWGLNAMASSFGWQASLLALPVLFMIYRSHRMYVDGLEEAKNKAEQQRIHAEQLTALHRRTIETLALAIEAKDQTTADHLARVEVYALEIGRELGLSEDELKALEAAALLHDIGKLAVPEYIISKPGKLTHEEFEKMKIHPVVGAELVEQVEFPYPVAPIVRAHHEKWDGSGYPDGVSGENIPIGARILSTVDCLDALASDRQYRRALPLPEALGVVQRDSGKAFDPRVVEVLSRRYVDLERMARERVAQTAHRTKLSTDIKIQRGAAPGAGFEESAAMGTDLLKLQKSVNSERDSQALELLTERMGAAATPEEAFAALQQVVASVVPYQLMVVYGRKGEALVPEYMDGEGQEQFASLEIPLGMGLAGWVAENHKAIMNGNPTVEPGYLNDPSRWTMLSSALAVPLESPTSETGVLSLYRRDRDAFLPDEMRLLQAIASRAARVIEFSSAV